jgi:hypothetical protein
MVKLSNLWRRLTTHKSSVKPFASEAAAESAPSSPRHHSESPTPEQVIRPASTNEEVRPLCSTPKAILTDGAPAVGRTLDTPASKEGLIDLTRDEVDCPSSRSSDVPVDVVCSAQKAGATPAGTPVAKEASLSSIDVPLSEVMSNVAEEFGQITATSLRSTKWDKRVQALKAMGTVFKGLDLGRGAAKPSAMKGLRLRDRASCWRTICQVLGHSISDKVMPVRLASHDLFCEVFSNTDNSVSVEEVRFAVRSLLSKIVDGLGDSNLRLHESSRKCVLFCAESQNLVGLKMVLQLLEDRLRSVGKSRERVKVHFGVLDTVGFLLRRFPEGTVEGDLDANPSSWTLKDISPFVVAGMDDSVGPRVRSIAVTLAVTLRVTFGSEAVEPLIASFRPAVQSLLREKFSDLEDELGPEADGNGELEGFVEPSPDDMAGLIICGSAIRASKPAELGSLPGTVACHEEDLLMDEILEDTGMVFAGSSSDNAGKTSALPGVLDACEEQMLLDLSAEPGSSESRKRSVRFNLDSEMNAIEVF